MRSSVYVKEGNADQKKVNRYSKISNAGKVLGVIPVVGAVVGAARIITPITDDKQLYGGSRLKQAGFVARGATEIIGLGILWGIADAVSSLFRALSGKKTDVINQPDVIKTENSELSETQQQKKDFIMKKIRQIMADGFFVLDGKEHQVTPTNFRGMVPQFFWSIQDDDSQHLFTPQELDDIKNFLFLPIDESTSCSPTAMTDG